MKWVAGADLRLRDSTFMTGLSLRCGSHFANPFGPLRFIAQAPLLHVARFLSTVFNTACLDHMRNSGISVSRISLRIHPQKDLIDPK